MPDNLNTKFCPKCYQDKPASEFHKNPSMPDGLANWCKECFCTYKKTRRKLYGGCNETGLGIESWKQIDSTVRELAELQFEIDTENDNCKKRVELVKKYSEEIIEPLQAHQIGLRSMLIAFLKKNCESQSKIKKIYQFGTVVFHCGKMKLILNSLLAGQRLGKP